MNGRRLGGVLGTVAAGVAAAAGTSTTAATASPPTPLVTKLEDLVRAEAVEGGFFATPPGTDTVASMFALEAGSGTRWTRQAGTSVLAVARGALTLQNAKGCTTKEYRAGEAAVVPPGTYRVVNAADAPLEFAGMFAALPRRGSTPLADGHVSGPAGCGGGSAFGAASVATPVLSEFFRGTQVPIAAYGDSLHGRTAKGIRIKAGRDVLLGSYIGQPGFNSGWTTHQPAFAVMKSGRFSYYEARERGCVKSEEYVAGQAFTHVGGLHMATNEAVVPTEITIAYFNLPRGGFGSMLPVAGHTMDAIDFTPLPPGECPRLM